MCVTLQEVVASPALVIRDAMLPGMLSIQVWFPVVSSGMAQ